MNLEDLFPGLRGRAYTITSPADPGYNCVAWAVGRSNEWWWPSGNPKEVWPTGVAREETVPAFQAALQSLGFAVCSDATVEAGFEKIAVFANVFSTPQHAARQLANGRWTSKLGKLEDIEHELRDLEGDAYGTATLLMKRPVAVP